MTNDKLIDRVATSITADAKCSRCDTAATRSNGNRIRVTRRDDPANCDSTRRRHGATATDADGIDSRNNSGRAETGDAGCRITRATDIQVIKIVPGRRRSAYHNVVLRSGERTTYAANADTSAAKGRAMSNHK